MTETPTIPRELHHEGARKVRVDLGAGEVQITESQDGSTHVYLEARRFDDAAHELVQRSTMHVSADGDIVVDVPHRNYRPTPELLLRIETPAELEYRIRTGSADVTADVPVGDSRLDIGSGDVRLATVAGRLDVKAGSGDVDIEEATGALAISTGSGDVEVARAGDAVAVSTGSGDVEIGEAGGPVRAKVGSGDITIEKVLDHSVATSGSGDVRVEAAHGPSVVVESASGDVHVGVPEGIRTYLDLKTVTGDISCALRPAEKPEEGAPVLALRARTVSGDITVVRA